MGNDEVIQMVLRLRDEMSQNAAPMIAAMKQIGEQAAQVQEKTKTLGERLVTLGRSSTEWGKSLSVGVTAPITAAAAGLVALATNAASTGDAIAKNAREAGLSGQSFQELAFALGHVAQVTDTQLVAGFGQLTKRLGEAAGGSAPMLAAFDQLGITAEQIASGVVDTEGAFGALTAAMQAAATPAEAAALAGRLLGDDLGRKLAGALREGGGQLDTLRGQAHELGLVMSTDALAASEQFQDALSDLKGQFAALWREVGTELLPLLTNDLMPALKQHVIPAIKTLSEMVIGGIKWFTELSPPVQAIIGAVAGLAAVLGPILLTFGAVVSAITPVISVFGTLFGAIGGLTPIITAVGLALKAAFVVATGPVGLTIAAITALGVIWLKWGDDIKRIASEVYLSVKNWIQDKLGGVFTWLGEKVEAVTGFFSDMYDAVVGNSFVPDMVERIGQEFGLLGEKMVDPTKAATGETTTAFSDMATSITEGLTGFLDNINLGSLRLPKLSDMGFTIGKDGAIGLDITKLGDTVRSVGTGAVVSDLMGAGKALFGATDINPFAEFARQMGFLLDRKKPFLGIPDWIRAMPREDVVDQLLAMGVVEYRDGFLRPAAGYLGNDFRVGTGGFRDFGAGTPAMLHGREAVVPESQKESFAAEHSRELISEIRGMRQDLADFPRAIKVAMRDARAFA